MEVRPESAAARAERAADLTPEVHEEIALDGMEAVHFGDRGRDPQVRAERLRAARFHGPARYAAHSVAIGARPDRSSFPAEAPCPVLIAGASDDKVVPTAEQRRWAEANGVAYVEIAKTGHMLPVEAPEELAQAINEWWRTIGG